MAVADGHGGARYLRSDVGATRAITAAVEVCSEFVESTYNDPDTLNSGPNIARLAREELPKRLVRRWNELVVSHYLEHPLEAEDYAKLSEKQATEVKAEPALLYGATVLTVTLTDDFIVYAQLGDGDILCVSEDQEVSSPLEDDPSAFANETPSLCNKGAWTNFRVTYRPTLDDMPALILLMTDGYRNSFGNLEGFKAVGCDILAELDKSGVAAVQNQLIKALLETTEQGSGDDITLGCIYRSSRRAESSGAAVIEITSAVVPANEDAEIHIAVNNATESKVDTVMTGPSEDTSTMEHPASLNEENGPDTSGTETPIIHYPTE